MKTFLGATLAALVFATPVLATAAMVGNAAGRQPELMAANSGATISSAYAETHPYAVLDNQDGIHLMPISPVARGAVVPYDHALALVNRTGGER
jgi:hypothetical protein